MNKNTLLITGGTGSFGKAVLNRLFKTDKFSEIRIFSRDEKKQDDLRKKLNDSIVKFVLAMLESIIDKLADFLSSRFKYCC